MVYYEEEYPDLLFAKDGEVFDFNGKQTIVTGGAYSVDRMYRLIHGYGWWPDEQPSEEIKQNVEQKLDELSWNVDVVLSHTVPLKYEPTEVFLEGLDQSKWIEQQRNGWIKLRIDLIIRNGTAVIIISAKEQISFSLCLMTLKN